VKLSWERRVCRLEQARAARCRTHFFFQNPGETSDLVDAQIRAKIASGKASWNDRFVRFCRQSPAEPDAAG
jgi:hypothetical protein